MNYPFRLGFECSVVYYIAEMPALLLECVLGANKMAVELSGYKSLLKFNNSLFMERHLLIIRTRFEKK